MGMVHKASKSVCFHSNQFSLPQIPAFYKGRSENKSPVVPAASQRVTDVGLLTNILWPLDRRSVAADNSLRRLVIVVTPLGPLDRNRSVN